MGNNETRLTPTNVLNRSYDSTLDVIVVLPLEFDPSGSTKRPVTGDLAVKVTVVGSITYIGEATPGSLQSSAVWRCKKVDETTGTVVTWCDGNTNFDNVATTLESLSYS